MMNKDHPWKIAICDRRSGPEKLWRRALPSHHQLRFFDTVEELQRSASLDPDDISDGAPHLVVLDWDGVDGESGQLIQHLRLEKQNGMATLVVVDEEASDLAMEACELGANDYITRPIDQFDLGTRVANLLIHRPRTLSLPEHYPPFRFDLNRKTVLYDGQLHRPRAKEFDLMVYFFRRPDHTHSRIDLSEQVWFGDSEACRSIDTYISRIRKAFGLDGRSGWAIKSDYGRGYRLIRYDDK